MTSRSVRQAAFGTFVDLGLVGAAVITVPRLVGTTTTGSEVLAAQVLVFWQRRPCGPSRSSPSSFGCWNVYGDREAGFAVR